MSYEGVYVLKSVDNFQKVYDQATERDRQIAIGSYLKYHRLTAAIAAKHGFTSTVGAAIFAALSPNNDYWGNLRDADKLLAAARAWKGLEDFTVSTYGPNKRKAWAIAQGGAPDDLIIALKTRNFFHNVDDPTDPNWVTIDGHMFNVFHGVRRPIQSKNNKNRVVKVSRSAYIEIASAVRTFAENYELLPCAMQGILWMTWRRLHNIRTSPQLDLWDRDYLAASLGFVPCETVQEKA